MAGSLPQLSDKVLTKRLREPVSAGGVAKSTSNGFLQRTEYRGSETTSRWIATGFTTAMKTCLAIHMNSRRYLRAWMVSQ